MSTLNSWNSANPPTVGQGGTGDTSFTAYSVICGGTTSTGNLQNVSGVGSSGQVLTSNGAAALPTWQAASAGSLVLIQTQTASNSTQLSWTTNITTYTTFMFVWQNAVPASNNASLQIQISDDAGATWKATSYTANINRMTSGSPLWFNTNISSAFLLNLQAPNSSPGTSGQYWITTRGSSTQPCGWGNFYDNGAGTFGLTYATYGSNITVNGFRVVQSTGNITSGTFSLYGVVT